MTERVKVINVMKRGTGGATHTSICVWDMGRMEGMRVQVSAQLLSPGSSPTSSSRGAGHGGDDILLYDWHAEFVPFG